MLFILSLLASLNAMIRQLGSLKLFLVYKYLYIRNIRGPVAIGHNYTLECIVCRMLMLGSSCILLLMFVLLCIS